MKINKQTNDGNKNGTDDAALADGLPSRQMLQVRIL